MLNCDDLIFSVFCSLTKLNRKIYLPDDWTKCGNFALWYEEANSKTPQQVLERLAGYTFYNTSDFDLAGLLDEALAIVENFRFYPESFSPDIKDMLITKLMFKEKISDLDKNNRLLGVLTAATHQSPGSR